MFSGYAANQGNFTLAKPRGLSVRSLSTILLWLTLASSSIVLIEPAPFDGLMAGLLVLLPLAGLASLNRRLSIYLLFWVIIGAAGMVASTQSGDMSTSIKHTVISVFLSFISVLIAATIRENPSRNAHVIMSGLFLAMMIAAILGMLGYFKLMPGAYELLTKFDRAKGAFKDPNVYGAFLVPAIVYSLHRMATARARRALLQAGLMGIFCVALLVSFSRGAWLQMVLAVSIYAVIAFIVSHTDRFRLKLFVLAAFGFAALILGFVALLQIEAVSELIRQRASLAMGYDSGPEGRFGGQLKALGMISELPLGLGALEFSHSYHAEDVHNVYLSMFLNSGWIGGFLYLALVMATIGTAFSHSLRKTELQGLMVVMLASFTGLAIEGAIIDTDHWRHFYILMGIIWGLAAANDRRQASPVHRQPAGSF